MARAARLASLPISLWGKMTILRAYLRPKVLFQLAVAEESKEELEKWERVEWRFLNSTGGLSENSRALIRVERAHPLTWGRLPLLKWELDRRRMALFPALRDVVGGGPGQGPPLYNIHYRKEVEGPWGSLVASRWRGLGVLGIRAGEQRRDHQGQGWRCRAPPSVLDTGSKEEIVQQLDGRARELPLVLTEGQKEWAEEFGTN